MDLRCTVFSVVLIFIINAKLGDSLECYVCKHQEDNVEKCLKTIKTCEHHQDVCMTEIKWGSTPYWSQGAKKQYYVSKRCSTKAECTTMRQRYMPFCTHLWYQDWACSDCCQGDRCNYYVINVSSLSSVNTAVTLCVSIITLFLVL